MRAGALISCPQFALQVYARAEHSSMARGDHALDAVIGAEESEGLIELLLHERGEGLKRFLTSAHALNGVHPRRRIILRAVSGYKSTLYFSGL